MIGSSSAANVTSVTPGAVGVTQAANSVALHDYTDASTATAYSLSQQLVTSATNVVYAIEPLAWDHHVDVDFTHAPPARA